MAKPLECCVVEMLLVWVLRCGSPFTCGSPFHCGSPFQDQTLLGKLGIIAGTASNPLLLISTNRGVREEIISSENPQRTGERERGSSQERKEAEEERLVIKWAMICSSLCFQVCLWSTVCFQTSELLGCLFSTVSFKRRYLCK